MERHQLTLTGMAQAHASNTKRSTVAILLTASMLGGGSHLSQTTISNPTLQSVQWESWKALYLLTYLKHLYSHPSCTKLWAAYFPLKRKYCKRISTENIEGIPKEMYFLLGFSPSLFASSLKQKQEPNRPVGEDCWLNYDSPSNNSIFCGAQQTPIERNTFYWMDRLFYFLQTQSYITTCIRTCIFLVIKEIFTILIAVLWRLRYDLKILISENNKNLELPFSERRDQNLRQLLCSCL